LHQKCVRNYEDKDNAFNLTSTSLVSDKIKSVCVTQCNTVTSNIKCTSTLEEYRIWKVQV
jgi:hypothetical protein